MITSVVQRWRAHRSSYRPAGEPINTSLYEVAEIAGDGSDTTVKRFVLKHHYAGTFPAARRRFGLFRGGELVGVAVFTIPQQPAVLAPFPGDPSEKAELGRFVLLDDVPANGETWFLARCFEILRRAGFVSIVSFSDPVPRRRADGVLVLRGHVGTAYQAGGGGYYGLSKPEWKFLLPDGTILCGRSLSKLRNGERSGRHVIKLLVSHGAPEPANDVADWATYWAEKLTRRFFHTGNHRYAWVLDKRRGALLPSLPYPKFDLARAAA